MKDLTSRVEAIVNRQRLIEAGARVGVAVSGGLDSVVLLEVLNRLKEAYGWHLIVLHFNHQLRGPASWSDEKFVRALANSLGLQLKIGRGDVRRWAERQKVSVEMAARQLRHQFLARAGRSVAASRVVLAHHADDQVELFFLRLLRGAGLEGLGGMRARAPSPADGKIELVRPLLELPRADLAQFARQEGLEYREDATNLETEFARNRVRHALLPLLRTEFQPSLDAVVTRLMEVARGESEFVAEETRRARERDDPRFDDLPVALQRRWLIEELRAAGIGPEFERIERLRREPGRPWVIGPGTALWRDGDGQVHLRSDAPSVFELAERRLSLRKPHGAASFDGVQVRWRRTRPPGDGKPVPCSGRETFDSDKVGASIRLRHWRPGDRFQPIGIRQPVKLQDLFTNRKIPVRVRRQVVVAETAGGIVFWVEGLRISELAKVDDGTEQVLNWKWKRRENLGLTSGAK